MEYNKNEIVPGTVLTATETVIAYRDNLVPEGITFVDIKTGEIPKLRALFKLDNFYVAARDMRLNK